MGQSLNLFNKETSLKYLNDLYIHARNRGLKSTYYLRNLPASKIEKSIDTPMKEIESKHEAVEEMVNACSILDPTCESCQ
jgi:uncharacterized protein (UPF0276 family)